MYLVLTALYHAASNVLTWRSRSDVSDIAASARERSSPATSFLPGERRLPLSGAGLCGTPVCARERARSRVAADCERRRNLCALAPPVADCRLAIRRTADNFTRAGRGA